MILNVAVLYRGRVIPALDPDQAGLPDGGAVIPLAHIGVFEDVAGIAVMELRRSLLHGLLDVQDEGELVVFHRDRPNALPGGDLVFRDDDGDVVAPVAHVPVQQVPVGHVLMARVHGPGVSRGGEGEIRYVEAGEHLHNAGYRLGGAGVDGTHHGVGLFRVLDADIESVCGYQVLVIPGAPACLVEAVDAFFADSDLAHDSALLESSRGRKGLTGGRGI